MAFDLYSALRDQGVFIPGHFRFASGRHGDTYVNKDAVFVSPQLTSRLCRMLALRCAHAQPEVVIGAATGGIALAHWLAHHLARVSSGPTKPFAAFAEKDGSGGYVLRRTHADLVKGRRVLVVEDVLNTGGTVRAVVGAVRRLGGFPVGIATLCERDEKGADRVDAPWIESLLRLNLPSWMVDKCPLCIDGIPLNSQYGHSRTY